MPCAGARLGASPIAAVSSDYAGLDAFFAERGVEYLHCGKYKDQQAKNDAERAARQFDVVRRKYGQYPALRETPTGKEILAVCRTSPPAIMNRGVIDGLALCFINDVIGYGCFTQRDIRAGTYIGIYAGIISAFSYVDTSGAYVMATNPFYNMLLSASMGSGFISIHGRVPKMVVDAERGGNELRFANHIDSHALLKGRSKKAENIKLRPLFYWSLFHVVCVAARDIQAGEELRFDYGPGILRKCGVTPDNSKVFRLDNDRLVEVPTTLP